MVGGDLIGVNTAIRMPGDLHTTIQARLTTTFRADIRQGFLEFDSWARDLLKKNTGNRWRGRVKGHGEGDTGGQEVPFQVKPHRRQLSPVFALEPCRVSLTLYGCKNIGFSLPCVCSLHKLPVLHLPK